MRPVGRCARELVETVLLEIGYSRTRPYAQVEYHLSKANGERSRNDRWHLATRTRVRKISDSELQDVYPVIEQCMTQIVLECRETWQHKDRWWVGGPGPVERGICFTFDRTDRSLYRSVLFEDIRYRKERYIRGHARRIHRLIGKYKFSDYSEQQLRRFSGVERVATLVKDVSYYDPFYRRVLLECFPPGSHTRLLLDHMNSMFRLGFEEPSEYATLVYDEDGPKLPAWKTIRARMVQQPTTQARNGLVVEITLERSYREHNECPF